MEKNILVIMTGGTIDAEAYDDTPRDIVPRSESAVPALLERMGVAKHCEFVPWRMKDSKDLTVAELEELADMIGTAKQHYVLVTHGTDAMAENSRFVKQQLVDVDKVVVFTGAMTPLAHGEKDSDGYANVIFAVDEMASLSHGVYVGMQGRWFEPDRLRKDFERKVFYEDPVEDEK